jgi:HAD superfamily hydrolase (TIGR01490 family)
MARGIAFFDVDHTVVKRSTGRYFISVGARRGLLPLSMLLSVPVYYLRYRYGHLDRYSLEIQLPALAGHQVCELEEIAREAFETKERDDIFPQAVQEVEAYREQGMEVVFASSSLDIILRPLADYLGVETLLATSLEFQDGVSTGRLSGNPLLGAEKRVRAKECAAERGVSMADCAFYSDSYHDIPLLEEVGRPVVVNPDRRLRKHAQSRGWEIVRYQL